MKEKIKIKSILLILSTIMLITCSLTNQTIAQAESITITEYGCTMCNSEDNNYTVGWVYTGSIPTVSIYFYDISLTTMEYIVAEGITNLGKYNWNMPVFHSLDGEYYIVVCDHINHNINDSALMNVYPIYTYSPSVSGYPILLIGLIIGIISVVITILLTEKLRKG
ncbi:MAG: hypothetical protein ACFFEY_12930 [Candidatus Thorarchaeota archaeon]